jgi:acetoin utilization deacetylase AcuC-like enzyme/GNAT superfamily N-acetyltransferase
MFRIRRIYDHLAPRNKQAMAQVQDILRAQFPGIPETDVAKLPTQLQNPVQYGFRSILFVADNMAGQVNGFALLLHMPDVHFCYLEFIAAAQRRTGGGIGGALYERVRQEAMDLNTVGVFFECLPDDPQVCHDPQLLRQNADRLRFYEHYGARPIINTAYQTPLSPDDTSLLPYLVYDNLGQESPLRRDTARAIVRAILERKYAHLCPPAYIDTVVASLVDDPIQLRPPRYTRKRPPVSRPRTRVGAKRIVLVVTDQHAIHHVHERGYVQSPVRIGAILREIRRTELFEESSIQHFAEAHIRAVHEPGFVNYLKNVCTHVPEGKSVYPYVFPIRNAARPPKELPVRAGYYCLDTFTPLNRNAYIAAKRAVDCALTAAQYLLTGSRVAYALVRPPGHHAERRVFGGFCYFNSGAIAAHYLSAYGTVAVLDIDYHHGNGTQDIFYDRPDVLTVSLHGHPRFAFPYFSGFEDEHGLAAGTGFNLNLPLAEHIDGAQYREALARALRRIERFKPDFLVIALGLDTARGDPTGSWSLRAKDFAANGSMLGALHRPTLVVQEGGYDSRSLGVNARHFFGGLWAGVVSRQS